MRCQGYPYLYAVLAFSLFYSVFDPTTSFLLASSPFAIVPAILALVPGKTMVGGKWERGGRRDAAVTRAFCWRSILFVSSVDTV